MAVARIPDPRGSALALSSSKLSVVPPPHICTHRISSFSFSIICLSFRALTSDLSNTCSTFFQSPHPLKAKSAVCTQLYCNWEWLTLSSIQCCVSFEQVLLIWPITLVILKRLVNEQVHRW